MPLDTLEQKIASLRAQAKSVSDDYDRRQLDIARDPNLSDAGKREELDPLLADVTTELQSLRQQEKDAITTKREQLERSLFGLPTGASSDPARLIGYRDAQDRASRLLNEADAESAYNSAVISDDRVLASAVLAQSLTLGFTKVIDAYFTRNPAARTDLTDLRQLLNYERSGGFSSLVHYMTPSGAITPAALPGMLDGMR